jgi:hypothetical protein
MQKLEAKIQTLQAEFDAAVRTHADACLAALEGGPDEIKARDKAHAKFVKAERAVADARAALTAASRHKDIEDQKAAAEALAAQQEHMAALHKKVLKTCGAMDDALDDVAALAITLREQTSELLLAGCRDAKKPIVNLDRALGSRLLRTGITAGTHHPFDDAPLLLVDMVPNLAETITVFTRRHQKSAA